MATQLASVPGIENVSEEFKQKVVQMARDLKTDPNYLMAIMSFETGGTFSPAVQNQAGSGAVGLIQFMPSTARELGTSSQALAMMTAEEQLDYVLKYFTPYQGRLDTLEDCYMAVLYPAAIGKGSNHHLFHRGTIEYAQNRGLDRNNDGVITVGEAAQLVRERLEAPQRQQAVSHNAQPILRQGFRGEAVKQLQQKLKQLGYNLGASGVDGIFGPIVKAAVIQFQQDRHLKPMDGIVGPQTWQALQQATPSQRQLQEGITGVLHAPVSGPITSHFGGRYHPVHGEYRQHKGIDFGVPEGTAVKAADGGKVIFIGYDQGWGNFVEVDHGDGWITRYAHLSKIDVKVGQMVKQGEAIASSGQTGTATGPHLHFELIKGGPYGTAVDPENYLGKTYQQITHQEQDAILFANAAETLLDQTEPAANSSRTYQGSTYTIREQGRSLRITAQGRGEILRVENGRPTINQVTPSDVFILSQVAHQVHFGRLAQGKPVRSDSNADLKVMGVANAAQTILEHRAKTAQDGSRNFNGNTYSIQQRGDTFCITAQGRGQILKIQGGKVAINKVTDADVSSLGKVAHQLNQAQQPAISQSPIQASLEKLNAVTAAIAQESAASVIEPVHRARAENKAPLRDREIALD